MGLLPKTSILKRLESPAFKANNKIPAKIPSIYAPLFTNDYIYFCFYGGRGGGKSENVAQSLVIMATQKKLRILCIRESQKSIDESVKSLVEKWIHELNLTNYFRITNYGIECLTTGSEFLFMGMKAHTAVNVKSIQGINITWIEEAEAFSKKSWDLLVPSVVRVAYPKIIITFNPANEDDIIYKEFVANKAPANTYLKKVTYEDNPFFKNTYLEQQRVDDLERLPREEYNHKWLGDLIKHSEGSLFKDCKLDEFMDISYARENYMQVVIACDPATTNKEFSNEYGIVILGKTREGLIHIISDESGNMSPFEFSVKVSKLSKQYETKDVVVEVNNGGDFIKATLISFDSSLRVKEVRASSDKINRALPVANLMSIGKIKLYDSSLRQLTRQMRLITNQGFMGSRGESPDRLDACVWGVYFLANIRDKDSIYSVFDTSILEQDDKWLEKAESLPKKIHYIMPHLDCFVILVAEALTKVSEIRIRIVDSLAFEDNESLLEYTKSLAKTRNLFVIQESQLTSFVAESVNCKLFEKAKDTDLDVKVRNIIPILKSKRVMISPSIPVAEYTKLGLRGELLKLDMMEFKYKDDGSKAGQSKYPRDYPFLDLLCELVYNELQLT